MEIKLQLFGRVYSLCIGRKTHWFHQIHFITLTEEWFYEKEIAYAKYIFGLIKEKNNVD